MSLSFESIPALANSRCSLLQSLNLPGSLQALEKPLGLPSSITSHAEEIRQQQGVHRLRRSMRDVETLKENDVATYQEGVNLLSTEVAEDERARTKYGTDRWIRPVSQKASERLYAQINEIAGYLKSADSSDALVKNKLKESEDVIRVLEGPPRDLEDFVPSSRKAVMPPKIEREAAKLRTILNEVNRLESRRRTKAEGLREKAKADDISKSSCGVHGYGIDLFRSCPSCRSESFRTRVPNAED